ncbi:MAG TPA: response regulator [Planctomycetota bacterium]|nr:response regulator [Planctomycetota bacterium]
MPMTAPLILIIDDDTDFLATTHDVIQAAGYRVVTVSNPSDALEAMAREKPQVVVTDLMMSALDSGFSLARQVKQDPRLCDVPVIVVTAVSSRLGFDFTPRQLSDLVAMHADAFIEKPFSPSDLLAKIEDLLRRQAGEKAR